MTRQAGALGNLGLKLLSCLLLIVTGIAPISGLAEIHLQETLQTEWVDQFGPQVIRGTIVKVSDGDTVHVQPHGMPKLKVRMVNMDTPETQLPVPGGMATQGYWGDSATAILKRLLPLGSVVDLVVYGRDQYGRTLGRIVKDNRDINLEMTRSGWGANYIICEGRDCDSGFWQRHDVMLYVRTCHEARAAGRGIYDPRKPIPELPFEFRLRMQQRTPNKFVGDVFTRRLVRPNDYREIDHCNRVFFMNEADALRHGFRY